MTFNNLPYSIVAIIASHLEEPLASYASISQSWKYAVESLTFRELRLYDAERLQKLRNTVTYDRRSAVRSIDLTVQLPEYEGDKFGEVESETDKQTNNKVFTETLKDLWQTLGSWEDGGEEADGKGTSRRGGLALQVQAISKSDFIHMPMAKKKERQMSADFGEVEDIFESRYGASYLRLTEDLPHLSSIVELAVLGQKRVRLISGTAVVAIMQSLPRLRKLDAELSDRESKDLDLRNRERQDFAKSLLTLQSKTLVNMRLHYPGVVPENQHFSPPVIPKTDGVDSFSASMHAFSQQLESLSITAVLSTDFYCPPTTDQEALSLWPNLQTLDLHIWSCTPSGEWIIERDPTEPASEENVDPDAEAYEGLSDWMRPAQIPARMHHPANTFRTSVRPQMMNDLYIVAGKAVARMPKLRSFVLRVGGRIHRFEFSSNGTDAAEVQWTGASATKYEPSNEVVETWRRACRRETVAA
ncbi:hypothetical protein AAFC00_007148 [Neodothiora populina]|uniref:DUF6546 domain-containing protein n=1 Tax=Neodothiora populina TaxID=2781224 RepID=A0ABR3PHB3_9PEZI